MYAECSPRAMLIKHFILQYIFKLKKYIADLMAVSGNAEWKK